MNAVYPGRGVGSQLAFAFVARRGDYSGSMPDRRIFFSNSGNEAGIALRSGVELVEAERMGSIDKGYGERILDLPCDIRGIGEMRMHDVGQPISLAQVL